MDKPINYEQELCISALKHDPDALLQAFATMGNEGRISFGLTLTVGGVVVTGKLVSERDYFTLLSQQFGTGIGWSEEEVAIFQSIIYPHEELPESADTPDDKDEDAYEPSSKYIHLKDAHIYLGSTRIPQEEGVMWRARLTSIDGFMLGEASPR